MYSQYFANLSKESQTLVMDAMQVLSPCYDPEKNIVFEPFEHVADNRSSMYYALGLMLLNEDKCAEKVEKLVDAVIATQFICPNEIFHGCFRSSGAPLPKENVLDYKRLGLYGRYFTDLFYEKTADAFRKSLKADTRFKDNALEIEALLGKAVISEFPVVWKTYEPNSREFILMCFAMLLEHFADKLSPACVEKIEQSSRAALQGAIMRSASDFNPLNTNIKCMHVFTVDYFGQRFGLPDYCAYALKYAEKMTADYLCYHSAAEYNSPTYCGVDLSTLGFWRRYGSCERLRELGKILEDGLWRDTVETFNPAMNNICGPYSRAYELELSKHTSFHALLFEGLGEEKFPLHPFTTETAINTLTAFGQITIPDDVKKSLFAPEEDVCFTHQFRELSERGEPGHNDALCTATGWISPDLMTGCLAGSENPSNQLHPLVVFWRGEKGLGTIKVQRATPEGKMNHMHTIFFNATADRTHLNMDVNFAVNRDIKLYFEIEYPGISDLAEITDTKWVLPGLDVVVDAKAPKCFVEKDCRVEGSEKGSVIRVCYLSETDKPETKQMSFDFNLKLSK